MNYFRVYVYVRSGIIFEKGGGQILVLKLRMLEVGKRRKGEGGVS
jgi:hypothetical protein